MVRTALRLAVAAAVLVAGALIASRLELRSGLADLLRSDDPVAREHARIADRLPTTLMMVLAIESPDRAANISAARRIAERVAQLGPRLVDKVMWNVHAERAFFEQRRWLYADLATLEAVRDRLQRAKNPLLVELDEPLLPKTRELDRFPSGYFEGEGGRFVVVLVRPARGMVGEDVGRELRDRTRAIVRELALPVHVELGGNLIVQLGEREALLRDLARASIACLVLVAVVVFVFFARLRVVVLFCVPSLIGVAVGYAVAAIAWGYVNMSAAFLGSIIVGNGINFAIVQQARYDEERRRGTPAREAAQIAVRTTRGATLLAALVAAAAYGSLLLTQFRGFSQFGAIGAAGMLAAWAATVGVLPALWAVFDRGDAKRWFRELALPSRGRYSRWLLVAGAVITVAAIAALPRYLADPFEYDLTKLRDVGSASSTRRNARVEAIFGETVAPPVILADSPAHAREIRDRLRERAATPEGKRLISAVRTLDDFVPDDQPAKLAVLAEIRALIDELGDDDLANQRPPEALAPFTAADLPATIRDLFRETDGTLGRIVAIYDYSRITAYDGREQLNLAKLVGEVRLADGTVARAPILFAALLDGIAHDAPFAAGFSLLAVIVFLAVFERSATRVALVAGTLVIGVVWMIGAAAWLDVEVNFLNFIALPISFGVGADYAINMVRRWWLEGRRVERAVQSVGAALVLCSTTTVIGYGALLAADNQALVSFGAMAIAGELATLAAAVMMLPAALRFVERRGA